jgi:hypothetical protein
MARPRFTIAGLLGIVVFLAVGLAALRAATDAWDGGVFGVTLALLLVSVLLAVHRTGRRRAYWLGFALFGWAYLVMSLVPPVEARLPTTKALAYLDSKVPGRIVTSIAFSPDGRSIHTRHGPMVRLWDATTGKLVAGPNDTSEDFVRIGHSLLALVLSFLGAHLSRSLYASGRPGHAQESDILSPSAAGSDLA